MASGRGAKLVITYRDYAKRNEDEYLDQKTYSNLAWNSDGKSAYVNIEEDDDGDPTGRILDFEGYKFRSVTKDPVYLTSASTFYTTVYYDKIEEETTYYNLSVIYRKAGTTSKISGQDETLSYEEGTTVYPDEDSDIRKSISGYLFSYAGSSSVKMSGNKTVYMYYEPYTNSIWSYSNCTSSSVTFTITTASSWNSTCYHSIEIINTTTNKTTTLSPPSSGSSKSVTATITGLSAGTSYTFRCRIVLPEDSNDKSNAYYLSNITQSTAQATATLSITCIDQVTGTLIKSVSKVLTVGSTYNIAENPPGCDGYTFKSASPSSGTITSSGASVTAYYVYTGTPDIEFELKVENRNTINVLITKMDSRTPYIQVRYYETDNISNGDIWPTANTWQYVDSSTYTVSLSDLSYNTKYKVAIRYTPDKSTSSNYTSPQEKTTGSNIVKITTEHYCGTDVIWNDSASPYSGTIGFDFTPTATDYLYDSSDYRFDYAMVGSTKYTSTSSKINLKNTTEDFTVKYYYTKITAQITIVHKATDGSFEITEEPFSALIDNWITPAKSDYVKPQTNYVFSYAEDPAGVKYSNGSTLQYKIIGDATLVYYYDYFESASFYVSEVGATYFELTVGLNYSFTSSNYQRLVFANKKATTNADGSITSISGEFLSWSVGEASDTSNTQVVSTTKLSEPLTPGNIYIVYCYAQAKNGRYFPVKTSDGNDYATVTLSTITDDVLIDGIYATWNAYYVSSSNLWSETTLTFTVNFDGDYAFRRQFFTEVGVTNISFSYPTTSTPSRLDYVETSTTSASSVTLTISNLRATSTLTTYFYVKTINGNYIQIPFGSGVGIYGKVVATKPAASDIAYTVGHVPQKDQVVNLLADDVLKFIRAMNCVAIWMFNEESSGIGDVEKGKPIYASTYIGFYGYLEKVKKHVYFNNIFQSVEAGWDIESTNLQNLPTSIKNMVAAIPHLDD